MNKPKQGIPKKKKLKLEKLKWKSIYSFGTKYPIEHRTQFYTYRILRGKSLSGWSHFTLEMRCHFTGSIRGMECRTLGAAKKIAAADIAKKAKRPKLSVNPSDWKTRSEEIIEFFGGR
jgi:hypothetical protein